jgi:ammonia channel protein AmtB
MAISTSDGVYLVWAACLALLMQTGFAMLEAVCQYNVVGVCLSSAARCVDRPTT